MTLKEAAAVLGVSKDAVRQRVRRDTLRSDKGEDGRVYVYLYASVDNVHAAKPPLSEASGAAGDDPFHQQMQARIDDLRHQLRREQDAHAEARRVILALTSRIPQLEAPSEPPSEARESDLSADAGAGRGDVPREELEGERELRERAEEKAAALEGELRALKELQAIMPPPAAPLRPSRGGSATSEPRSSTGDSQTAPQRSWWRRVFGG